MSKHWYLVYIYITKLNDVLMSISTFLSCLLFLTGHNVAGCSCHPLTPSVFQKYTAPASKEEERKEGM